MSINKNYKDSLFRSMFNNKSSPLELVNAIFGVDYQDESIIEINTILDVIFTAIKNDLSFILYNKILVLAEHQSTISENMPFRMLSYITEIYKNKNINDKKIYNESLVKMPRPVFIVLYNGKAPFPKEKVLRLSDAFEKIDSNDLISLDFNNLIELDLTTRIININKGVNPELERKSKTLNSYVTCIAKVREYEKEYPLAKAGELAVKYCIKNDLSADYFRTHTSEVINMLLKEYNQEEHIKAIREENLQKGIEKGRVEGIEKFQNYVLDLMEQGLSQEEIKKKIKEAQKNLNS